MKYHKPLFFSFSRGLFLWFSHQDQIFFLLKRDRPKKTLRRLLGVFFALDYLSAYEEKTLIGFKKKRAGIRIPPIRGLSGHGLGLFLAAP
jgi:hypothetical protein